LFFYKGKIHVSNEHLKCFLLFLVSKKLHRLNIKHKFSVTFQFLDIKWSQGLNFLTILLKMIKLQEEQLKLIENSLVVFIPYFWMNVMSVYSLSNSLVFDKPNLLISKKFLPKFVKILQKKFVFSGDKLTISFHKFWYKSLSMKCLSLSCN